MTDIDPEKALDLFIQKEGLPDSYSETVKAWFMPLTEELIPRIKSQGPGFRLGISGCQGSGKSTLAELLVLLFDLFAGLRAVNLSMDDFYYGHAYRQQLGKEINPMLATRGVPGTHDIALMESVVSDLAHSGTVKIPRFNKAQDDRYPEQEWSECEAPVDVVIIEGWCLGIPAQDDHALLEPINALEQNADEQGVWRQYVNENLANSYQPFYDKLDTLVMLRAPAFEKVFEWRQNQEDKLATKSAHGVNNKLMSPAQLLRFIQHYERLTRHGLDVLPALADMVFQLNDQQRIETRSK